MGQAQTQKIKTGMIIFYVVAVVSPYLPLLASVSGILHFILGFLVIAHFVEFLLKRNELDALKTNDNHFIQTMLFGFLHWKPLLSNHKQQA